jgi:OOP family OmpA-OmpF porin
LFKPILAAAVALAALPVVAHAQEINSQPGFYIGGGGGLVVPLASNGSGGNVGWAAGGKIGYDFVGPRIDLDVGYGQLPLNFNARGTALDG